MSQFWKGKKVLVTGGAGFIGSFVTEKLVQLGANVTVVSRNGNFENIKSVKKNTITKILDINSIDDSIKATKNQDIVLHLAAKVAGIQYNISHSASIFGKNIILAKNILDASVKNKVERILLTSSACVYPAESKIPTPESEGFVGDPEPTNLGYGWAKRTLELMGRFYNLEYGIKVAIARPYNTYGPRSDFNTSTSHVIPGIIKKLYEGENPLTIWGSGNQTRSFIFVEDVARGLLEVAQKYAIADPLNIGSKEEVTIKDLATKIIKISGKKVELKFDKSKPDGQQRRNCDISKAKTKIGFESKISLQEGLEKTVSWYKQL